jgi:glycerate dehydrogenase
MGSTQHTLKIVVLDGQTLNPGDLSWEVLEGLGSCIVYERTGPDQVVNRARDADVLLINKVVLDACIIRSLPRLSYVGVLATGTNVVDLDEARVQGVTVTNVPAYSTDSVAQMTFALLLELVNAVGRHSDAVHSGRWSGSADFSFHLSPLVELSGLTMGIVGYGAIGKAVARLAEAFRMKVLVHTRTPGKTAGVRYVDLDSVFRESDVVSLHCPLTSETEGLVTRDRLSVMKRTAFIINTSRGPVVDETALAEALDSGTIGGAAVDVLSTEPPSGDNPLLTARNCIITPHIAWATLAARRRLMETVVNNVRAWMEGRPVNVVNETVENRG